MKSKLMLLGAAFGVSSYVYMLAMTIKGTGEGLSFTTFALWSALGWISSFTMMKQGANAYVPMIYSAGATATALVLMLKGRYALSGLDVIVAALTVLCVVLWKTQGPRWALVLSIAAAMIAAVPFVVMTVRNPEASPVLANTGFLCANTLMFVSAKAWTLEDRLYPSANIVLCLFLIVPYLLR